MKFILVALLALLTLTSCSEKLVLTNAEHEFIKTNTVYWAVEENYPPFVYLDNGVPSGYSVEFLKEITAMTGLKIVPKEHCQLSKCLNLLKTGEVNMVSSVRATSERSVYAEFTRPYITVGSVLIKNVNTPATVGAGKGYAIVKYLNLNHPTLKITEFENDEDAILALISGSIDSVALDVESAKLLREKYKFNFDESSLAMDYPLSFAITKNDILLKSILDKAITKVGAKVLWK